jgi:hypothetical protein
VAVNPLNLADPLSVARVRRAKSRLGFVPWRRIEQVAWSETRRAHAEADGAGELARWRSRLHGAFNADADAARRLERAQEPGRERETADWLAHLGLDRSCPAITAAEFQARGARRYFETPPGDEPRGTGPYLVRDRSGACFVGYHVDERFHWLFRRDWFDAQMDRARRLLPMLSRRRRGDMCVIVGNGPSLARTDPALVARFDAFVSNLAIRSEVWARAATYHCVVNHLVADQARAEINALEGATRFFPYWLRPFLRGGDDTVFLNAAGYREFSTDPARRISWRATVSYFSMQVALALGYRTILLVGFDHRYVQPADAREGDPINQGDAPDVNHFDPGYFRGMAWHAADTAQMEDCYRLAQAALGPDRRIINCTEGGALEVFPRGRLEDFAPGGG